MSGTSAGGGYHRTLEMTISRAEFLRLLPAVTQGSRLDISPARSSGPAVMTIQWSEAACDGTIRLVPLPALRLANVVVSRHRVEIGLDGCSGADGEAFMKRFRRGFLRGGG